MAQEDGPEGLQLAGPKRLVHYMSLAYYITSCHVHVMSYHHVMSCHILSCHDHTSCHVMSRHIILLCFCFALLCFCFALLCFALLCFALHTGPHLAPNARNRFALLCFALLCFAKSKARCSQSQKQVKQDVPKVKRWMFPKSNWDVPKVKS
jgi:hypothetical protein